MWFWGWLFNGHRVVIRQRDKKRYKIALDVMPADTSEDQRDAQGVSAWYRQLATHSRRIVE